MKIGYARVSKSDGSQKFDLQIDALKRAGVEEDNIYYDKISGAKADRPGLAACLKALRPDDILVVWRLDRLGRNLRHLINMSQDLLDKKIELEILSGFGGGLDTTTPMGRMFFQIMAMMAEFERELIRERTMAGLASARARGRHGGRKFRLSKAQVRYLQAAMGQPETSIKELIKELGVSRATIYKYVGPDGTLRSTAIKVLEK